jgi:hypothetical protein
MGGVSSSPPLKRASSLRINGHSWGEKLKVKGLYIRYLFIQTKKDHKKKKQKNKQKKQKQKKISSISQ